MTIVVISAGDGRPVTTLTGAMDQAALQGRCAGSTLRALR
jgi:hypothetical protein